ncbi:MAG: hypothetical protein KME16_00915 [Scytolyngbya sp. HA4215-MV1]|nr:hypothetical protein [Scytolyngbya sp. HA4215-MV1]
MKPFKIIWVVGLLLFNLLIACPAWADAGKFMQTPEYTEVTQAIADLTNPEKTSDMTPAAIQQKLADLRFQKYILETAEGRSNCRNETGKTLAIYARSKKSTDAPILYFLGTGQAIDEDFECTGVYLPSGSKVILATIEQELANATAIKFVPGTQLIATANSDTGVIEFNAPAAQSFKAGEIDWSIPTLTSEEIATQTLNAPVD